MYFIFSKLLVIVLHPVLWVFILLVTGLFAKNSIRKKRLLIASAVVFYVFSTPLIFSQLANRWDILPSDVTADKTYSAAIVLGGFSSADRDGKGHFNQF